MQQSLRQSGALLHAFGEFAQMFLLVRAQSDFLNHLGNSRLQNGGGDVGQLAVELQKFLDLEVAIESGQFWEVADPFHHFAVR